MSKLNQIFTYTLSVNVWDSDEYVIVAPTVHQAYNILKKAVPEYNLDELPTFEEYKKSVGMFSVEGKPRLLIKNHYEE